MFTTSDNAFTFNLYSKKLPATLHHLLTSNRIAKLGFGVRKALDALYHRGCTDRRSQAVYDVERLISRDPRFSKKRFLRFDRFERAAYEYFPTGVDSRRNRSSTSPSFREIRSAEKLIMLSSYQDMFVADCYRRSFNDNFFETTSRNYVEGLETISSAMNHVALIAKHSLCLTLLAYEPNVRAMKLRGSFYDQACTFFNTSPHKRHFRSKDYRS